VQKIGNPVIAAYLQGLLLTGARRNELAALRWADVDFQWKSLTIRDKVEGERTIPLTPYLEQSRRTLLGKFNRGILMATLLELSHLYNLTDQLIEKATKQDIAETARSLAVNLAHYKMKYGELPLDKTLAMIDIEKPNAEQTVMLVNGMENLVGVLANVVMGLDEPRH